MELKAEKLKIKPCDLEIHEHHMARTISKVVLECTVMISNPCGCKFKFDIYDHVEYEQHVKTVALMDPNETLMLVELSENPLCCNGHFWYTAGEVKTALRKLTGSGSLEVEDSGEGPYKNRSRVLGAMGVVMYRRLEKMMKN